MTQGNVLDVSDRNRRSGSDRPLGDLPGGHAQFADLAAFSALADTRNAVSVRVQRLPPQLTDLTRRGVP